VVPLGTVDDHQYSRQHVGVEHINAGGTVVGYYSTASDYGLPLHGFIRSPNGIITTYDAPGATSYTVLVSINDAGGMIGYFYGGGSYDTHFKLSPKGVLTPISVPGDPTAINLEGQIVGNANLQQGYIWFPKQNLATVFTYPEGGVGQEYLTINNLGTVSGTWAATATTSVSHGFIRSRDGVITSFDPPGSANTVATGLNNLNVITGFYYTCAACGDGFGFIRYPGQ
jgi:hypothetical protein